jgi:hypothetical protein
MTGRDWTRRPMLVRVQAKNIGRSYGYVTSVPGLFTGLFPRVVPGCFLGRSYGYVTSVPGLFFAPMPTFSAISS